jgi:hypothetical protein
MQPSLIDEGGSMMDAAARLDRTAGPRAPEAGGHEGAREGT